MTESKSILHELYVFSEWKPEPEYLQKPDNLLPENISSLWRWLKFFGPKKSLIDSVTAHNERQQKWQIALGDEGKVIAVLTDSILEIRTKRSEYATIAARTTVSRDAYAQWRKVVWSPDCSFLVVAYGNGVVSFFDLTASNLFNIPADCSRPGGLECTDNTHAVSDIIFMPLRVKDTKWNWEVLVVTYDGKLRGYLVSQTEGYKLHHVFQFSGGVAAAVYCEPHNTLYVAGLPRPARDPESASAAGLTAWRVLNDEPFYKLSVVSDELEARLANERFQLYWPLVFNKNLDFIVRMSASPERGRLVCVHCSGAISVWSAPALRAERRFPLAEQPQHALASPLPAPAPAPSPSPAPPRPAHVAWWSNQEIIVSRFTGSVTVCELQELNNILGKKPEFFQGTPQITCAHDGVFMVLECESNVMPAKKSRSDESMEVVPADEEVDDSMLELAKELFKSVLYTITDIETFQPKPKKITVVSRIYRLLGVKSTTPMELFSRKIESGNYTEALSLAETFDLDSDLVYQQQWRKNPVSTDAIHNYLSKVRKKIWAVHQCVDRLPESLPAANELLHFGLQLTNQKILEEINKGLPEERWVGPAGVTPAALNAYTSELLRCRHVMLFYKERLALYEAILRCEKSTYVKDEYDRLRSNSIMHSAMEIAKEGRIEALTCLWPYIKSLDMQLAVLDKIPETLCPLTYQHLLPTKEPLEWFEKKSPIKIKPFEHENDWCRNEIFRPIWSSNWSSDKTPEGAEGAAGAADSAGAAGDEAGAAVLTGWYERRARAIERRSGLASHALRLVAAAQAGAVPGLERALFLLRTLDTLLYDLNVEGVSLDDLETMPNLEICKLLMKMSTRETFIADLKQFLVPFLKRYQDLTRFPGACLSGLIEFLEDISKEDLSYILLVLQSHKEFELDVKVHLELVERCLFAHTGTEQLDMACDLLATILKETDGSIAPTALVRRCAELERLVAGSGRLAWRGVRVPPCALRGLNRDEQHARQLLTRVARGLANGEEKPTQQDWENLLKDMLELQNTLFDCVTPEQCYEIYASSLLTSGDATSIRLSGAVLTVSPAGPPAPPAQYRIDYKRSVELVLNAATEYFNSASSLTDPALEIARCCLLLIEDGNKEIEQELDLISALPILSAFNLTILPIQVRLCEDRMKLIEDCLASDPNAYLASHKLLKLAKLLRIAGDDEQNREGTVLMAVCARALAAGAAGGGAAGAAARRLAALRHAPAAALLARTAQHAHAHADTPERSRLLAAALAHAPPAALHDMIHARLNLELESLQQMGAALRDNHRLEARWSSTEDEFADAITTPVIEKKDLVPSPQTEKQVPLLNFLLDTVQNKFNSSSGKPVSSDTTERTVHCQEFYRSLYLEHDVSSNYYCYDRFSIPDDLDGESSIGQAVLKWFHIQNSLEEGAMGELEADVTHKCAEELVYKDTALSVAAALRVRGGLRAGPARAAACAALYAALVAANAPALRDHAYLAAPAQLAHITLKQKNASEEQMEIIRQCIDKLSGMGEVERIRALGLSVNGLLFNADKDYRREVIYRLAKSVGAEQVRLSCALAEKYQLDALDVWLHAACAAPARASPAAAPRAPHAPQRIRETLWPVIEGNDYVGLLNFFTVLKNIEDKTLMYGLTAVEHIKLLKKAKAASQDLDYKLLLDQPSAEQFTEHILSITKPENVGLLMKFLRTLPPACRLPLSVNSLFTMWLTKYFFSVGASGASKKWMQQWRQCASYFTKLPKDELLQFVAATCFSSDALLRVPPGTRNLMIMQAVDYCQQEQENDFKFNKNEQSWAQVGQELSRWARFLENYHSDSVQAIVAASDLPRDQVWPDLEKSHGDTEQVVDALARLVLHGGLRPAHLSSLLQLLRVPAETTDVFQRLLVTCEHSLDDTAALAARVAQYHRAGAALGERVLQAAARQAARAGLPPQQQLGLLSLGRRAQPAADLRQVALSTLQLFRAEWPDRDCAHRDEESLLTPEGRQEAYNELVNACDSWQRKKALVDVLACWPPTHSDSRSLHCDYLYRLLSQDADVKESLVLIKLLLTRPVLEDEEIKWLTENAGSNSLINTIWVILLSKSEISQDLLRNLVLEHKDSIQKEEIEEDLIKELLDQGMFIKMVSTPLYSSIINYIMNADSCGVDASNTYTIQWAAAELIKANYLAEAGNLQLLITGVPSVLRGFSQAVLYCNKMPQQ
ncbi:NBAS subunit of NRZ tethering complex-like isoform X2 [Vanessa cardui]|uniref:NBAS subunit of NRZ tethering complex-like isoform X2 n=1 Tax=Vanessa cardui TaxID=171605 RepID=UPI001F13BA1A|nr:NBAS subunit of NRZ tethering complex-like isoform X2 [Vanessa cardui]